MYKNQGEKYRLTEPICPITNTFVFFTWYHLKSCAVILSKMVSKTKTA